MKEEDKDLNYWKENAKDAYMTTPICVLRYITELEKAVKNNAVLPHVGNSALQNNNKLIENMCISYRHDFGLMKEEEKNDLRFQCKEWLRAYENNREHCC